MKAIMIFGGSATYGKFSKLGWPELLRQKITTTDESTYVYNLGIEGSNSDMLLSRLENELSARLYHVTDPSRDVAVLIVIGLNDAQFNLRTQKFRVPQERFKKNLREMIRIVKKTTPLLVILGPTWVDKVSPMIGEDTEKVYSNENIMKYNSIIKSVCEEDDISFVDIYPIFEANPKLLLPDGMHPSTAGLKAVFNKVLPVLAEKIFPKMELRV